MRDLKIVVNDKTNISDRLHTYKQWFNGIKRFFTVKPLPPRN